MVGLEADPAHVAMARRYVGELGLANVEIVAADARHTGLSPNRFDLAHARTVLVTIPEPEQVLAEMVRLARPGGWVASQNPTPRTRSVTRRFLPGTGSARFSAPASAAPVPTC